MTSSWRSVPPEPFRLMGVVLARTTTGNVALRAATEVAGSQVTVNASMVAYHL